jgi:hypothetical protein
MIERLKRLPPHVLDEIWFYLDPFPEFVALVQSALVVATYSGRDQPRWTHDIEIKLGMTLFTKFQAWNGHPYLSSLDTTRNRQDQTQMLQVADTLIVCRDSFGIRALYGSSEEIHDWDPGLFFHTIPLRAQGRKLSKLRGFFDVSACQAPHFLTEYHQGKFLRTLNAERSASRPIIEWNMPTLPKRAFRFSSEALSPRLGALRRYVCHEFKDISGISAAVQHCKTVGLFCHTKGETRGRFKFFIKQMESLFGSSLLVFPYFPLNDRELLQTVGVRWVKDSRFSLSNPVIQVCPLLPSVD